MNRQKQ